MKAPVMLCCLFAAGFLFPVHALTVRVDANKGAPRLLVDNVPVRARMFYGAPGNMPLDLAAEWKILDFQFTATGSASNGTIHFRFGQQPGEVWLDDISIKDLTTGLSVLHSHFESTNSFSRDWTYWPPGPANTVAAITTETNNDSSALHISLKAPATGKWPDFHIYSRGRMAIEKDHVYQVTFRARANAPRRLATAVYQPGERFVRLGGPPDCFPQQIKLANDAGVYFITFPIGLPWPKPGALPDWSDVDEACETVLRANPNALLIPRIPMNPPRWWREAHPDDVMQWEDGHRDHMVVASPQYRQDAAERLKAVVAHIEQKFGEHTAGYHPCGQNTGEWFYEDTWKRPLSGYAPADLTAWRKWLDHRDPAGTELRMSWHMPDIKNESAPVPSAAARHSATNGIFRDANSERMLIDWAEFQQQMMADCVTNLAHAVRQASGGNKLVVFFYGYVFEFAAVENGPATSGHYALRRVLTSPDIDVLCSPISYFDRGLGESAPSMTAAESVALAGKLWLNEDDTHTYLATGTPPGSKEHVNTIEETNAELTRNIAQETLRHFGTWWMDLGASGWFNDPRMWDQQVKLRDFDDPSSRDLPPFRPDVAAVIDERCMRLLAPGSTAVTRPGIYQARAALGRMGAPYGQYLLDDVLNGRVHPKLYIFLNAWRLPRGERQALLSTTRNTFSIWCYAPGYLGLDDLPRLETSDGQDGLTGFRYARVEGVKAMAQPTARGRALGLEHPIGIERIINPLLTVTNAKPDEVLATYPNGAPAIVLRDKSLFVGPPGLTSELLRLAARQARVHLFTTNDCNVYANGPFVALHASQDGPITLHTRRAKPITDQLTHAEVGHGPILTLPLKRGETRVLRVE